MINDQQPIFSSFSTAVLYPFGGGANDLRMNTTTIEDEEREAVLGHFRLNTLILGLRNLYVSSAEWCQNDYQC